jgi:hypothetical protein
MNQKILASLVLLISAVVIGYCAYTGFYRPFFVLPEEDQAFLSAHPSREQVLQHFGRPAEQLRAGERFSMTGWHPLPDRAATDGAFSFVRRYGSKLYVFFGPGGEMEHFVISRS